MTALPLRFPRPIAAIVRDMERSRSRHQYDDLSAEYERHPEIVARRAEAAAIDAIIAEQDAIDALVDEQDRRGTPPLRLAN